MAILVKQMFSYVIIQCTPNYKYEFRFIPSRGWRCLRAHWNSHWCCFTQYVMVLNETQVVRCFQGQSSNRKAFLAWWTTFTILLTHWGYIVECYCCFITKLFDVIDIRSLLSCLSLYTTLCYHKQLLSVTSLQYMLFYDFATFVYYNYH